MPDYRMRFSHILLLVVACVVNLLPLLMQQVGGDSWVHLTRLHCFAVQFWHGNLLPRWCFEADGGVGSPALMFYPPLPYFITTLIYPLHSFGVSLYGVLVIAMALATLMAAFGAYAWLKDFAGPEAALPGALLYTFLPYHSEVLVGRAAYAELWVIAFAPFMARSLQQVISGRRSSLWPFTLWTTLACLCEPEVAFCILAGLAVLVLAEGFSAWKLWLRALVACLAAVLISSIYWLPAVHYMPFVDMPVLHESWVNRVMRPSQDLREGRVMFLFGFLLTAAGFAWLCICVWRRHRAITGSTSHRETMAWLVAGLVALFMLFPPSEPVWRLINAALPLGAPWRMQAMLLLSVSLLAAAWVRWLSHKPHAKRNTTQGNLAALLLMLVFVEMGLTNTVGGKDMDGFHRLIAASAMALPEYRTRWTSDDNADTAAAVYRYEDDNQSPAEIVNGAGVIRVQKWSWRGIVLQTDSMKPRITVRVYQRYFPLWQLAVKDNAYVQVQPEPETGYMLLTVPQGRHEISLTLEPWYDSFLGTGARRELAKQHQLAAAPDLALLQ